MDTHTDTRIIFIFTNVVFLGVSYMTYCPEMIDTKNTVRERVKSVTPINSDIESTPSDRFTSHREPTPPGLKHAPPPPPGEGARGSKLQGELKVRIFWQIRYHMQNGFTQTEVVPKCSVSSSVDLIQ